MSWFSTGSSTVINVAGNTALNGFYIPERHLRMCTAQASQTCASLYGHKRARYEFTNDNGKTVLNSSPIIGSSRTLLTRTLAVELQ